MIDVNSEFGFLTKMELLMDSNKDEDIESAIELLTGTRDFFNIGTVNFVLR